MREKGRGSDPWQDEYFIDLGASSSAERNSGRQKAKGRPPVRNPSYSGRDGTAPGRRPARRPGDSAPARPSVRPPRPEYGESDRARRKPGGGESRRRPAPAPARKRRKQKKPMSKKGRAVVYLLTFFGVLTSAVLLCVFLLFRVAQIEVTGDQVYSASDILKICGYETGDNLVFLPTKEQEEQLERELPYIEKAEVRKRLPGTLEISVTAAKVGACIESGGSWLYLSENGKLLERQDKPMAGVMQIVGVTPEDSTLGTGLKLSDANVETVFRQIMAKLVELDAVNKFTKLDLSDLYNIRIWYEGRIQFLLGNAADLAYKVEFGYKIASDPKSIGTQETGTLDLTVANDVKRSTFTADKPGRTTALRLSAAIRELCRILPQMIPLVRETPRTTDGMEGFPTTTLQAAGILPMEIQAVIPAISGIPEIPGILEMTEVPEIPAVPGMLETAPERGMECKGNCCFSLSELRKRAHLVAHCR